MKARWTTYLLLMAVAAVWGVVAWKIFAPASEDMPSAAPKTVAAKTPAIAADTLQFGYEDPFLKDAARPTAIVPATVRPLPAAKAARPKRDRVKIVHLGTVASKGHKFYILLVDSEQYEIQRGEVAGEFFFDRYDGDSLYLSKQGVTYGVKLCE